MNDEQMLAERILLLIESFPSDPGFQFSDRFIAVILCEGINPIKEILSELIQTNFIKRSRVNGYRTLTSLREIPVEDFEYFRENLSKEKKEKRSKKEKKENIYNKIGLLFSNVLLRNTLSTRSPGSASSRCESRAKSEKEDRPLSKYIERHVDLWNSLGLPTFWKKKETKIYRETVNYFNRLKRGHLFKGTLLHDVTTKFTDEDITTAIANFSKAVIDNNYDPLAGSSYHTYLSSVKISTFLLNPMSTTKIGTSLFYHYLKHPPKQFQVTGAIPDTFPTITSVFKRYYINNVLGGVIPIKGFTPKEEDNFRMAGMRTVEFYEKNKVKLSNFQMMGGINSITLAKWVCEALEKDVDGDTSKLTSGWFCSDMTFQKRLPKFLYKEGIIEEMINYG